MKIDEDGLIGHNTTIEYLMGDTMGIVLRKIYSRARLDKKCTQNNRSFLSNPAIKCVYGKPELFHHCIGLLGYVAQNSVNTQVGYVDWTGESSKLSSNVA